MQLVGELQVIYRNDIFCKNIIGRNAQITFYFKNDVTVFKNVCSSD